MTSDQDTTVNAAGRKRYFLVFGLVSLGVACVAIFYWKPGREHGPVATVANSIRRVTAKPGISKILENYTIVNSGTEELTLGEAVSSCGCTVASVQSARIKPGDSSTVAVEGRPPTSGERTVTVRITTNARRTKEIVLTLTMVGSQPPPYLRIPPTPVQFGFINTLPITERLEIIAIEKANTPHFINQPFGTISSLDVRSGPVTEVPLGNGVVERRYLFDCKLDNVESHGPFKGEILFRGSDGLTLADLKIPVHGELRAPVYSIPSSLYTTFDPGSEHPVLRLIIASADRDFHMDANPPEDVPRGVTIRRVEAGKTGIVFEVSTCDGLSSPLSVKLDFTTNHPTVRVVSVPLLLRSSGD